MKEAIENKPIIPASEVLAPLTFTPVFKSVIWGGTRIGEYKREPLTQTSVGESWEISGIPGHETIVADGPLKGKTIGELMTLYGPRLIGRRLHSRGIKEFPILIKFLDARDNLSLQVHPGEEIARSRHNCPGKSEMWYIIDSAPDSTIISGFSKPITRGKYREQVERGEILQSVAQHPSHPGDVFFIPAGRVHGVGSGNFLLEVQQSSDITYRIYDYDRCDKDGNRRELHTEQAAEAIDYRVYDNYKIDPISIKPGVEVLVQCPVFEVRLLTINGSLDFATPDDSFLTMTCVYGEADIIAGGTTTPLQQGHSLLIPAESRDVTIKGNARIIAASC